MNRKLFEIKIHKQMFAVVRVEGAQYYFVDDKQVTTNEYLQQVAKARAKLEKIQQQMFGESRS